MFPPPHAALAENLGAPSKAGSTSMGAAWATGKAIGDAGLELGDVFDVTETFITKPDLDKKQYELFKPVLLQQFRTLVRQRKPSLK